MTITRYAVGTHKSDMVAHNGVLYVSGMVGDDYKAPLDEQMTSLLATLERLLLEGGSSKERILSSTIWLASIDDRAVVNQHWIAWLPKGHPPARACIGALLADPDLKVEIALIAAQN